MPLTDIEITNAKPREKPFRLADNEGLYLEVSPAGGKWWRFKYRFGGKEKRLSLGVYPAVPLAGHKDQRTGLWIDGARDKRNDARKMIASGIDPAEQRKAVKQTEAGAASFEAIAREWHTKFSTRWVASHSDRVLRRLEADIFPWLGRDPIKNISAPQLLATLRRIETRGAIETAHRARENCGQVFRYAVATGRAERDPTADLRGALPPSKEKHLASITDPDEIGGLLRAIRGYKGSLITACALKLAPLVFVRPGELRRAEWKEIDLKAAEWRIPEEKMKSRALHIVPLSAQAIEVLRELEPLTGAGPYVFPSVRSRRRPMSENTILAALRRMGYTGAQMTGHGFRSMASTLLNEMGWNRDAIERQLAHAERDKTRAAYNRAEHLPERRKMMQAWADYLDRLATESKVVTGNFGKAA